MAVARTLATTGTAGGLDGNAAQRIGHGIGGGLHHGAMERRRYIERHEAAHAMLLGELAGAIDGRLGARR